MKAAIICFPYISETFIESQYLAGLYKIATYCSKDYKIYVLDQRINRNVVDIVHKILKGEKEVLCVGLSVMTGSQILSAIQISKALHKRVNIVWGGMHPRLLMAFAVSMRS